MHSWVCAAHIQVCVSLCASLREWLCHILECERAAADGVCLRLNQPENTHVGMSAVSAIGVCDHLRRAQCSGSWLMPCSC